MNDITVAKQELIDALRKNRDEHRQIFEEALVGFAQEAQEELEAHLERLRQGRRRTIFIQRIVPEDHTRDYDRAIRMIEMSLGNTITLSERDFRVYVMDDWGWTHEFAEATNAYSAMSRTKFGDG